MGLFKRGRWWLGLVVTLFFLAWLFYGIDFAAVGRALAHADLLWLAPAIAVYFVGFWFRAVRWRVLLEPVKVITARRLFPFLAIGYMANNVLPVRLGELVRAHVLGTREKVSRMAVLATILAERILDGLTLLFFVVAVALFIPLNEWLRWVVWAGFALYLGALALALALLYARGLSVALLSRLLRFLPARAGERAAALADLFIGGLASLRDPRRLAQAGALSLVIWLFEGGMFYVVGLAFRLEVPLNGYLVATALSNLATTLPTSQGGIGPFEAFTKWTLAFFGVGAELAAAYAILLHAALLLPVILLGLFYLWREDVSLARVARERLVEPPAQPV